MTAIASARRTPNAAAPPAKRTLHLIEPLRAGWSAIEALRCVLNDQRSYLEHRALLVGSSEDERFAADLGVNTMNRIQAPAGRVTLAATGLRRFIEAHGEPDLIHAWSWRTLRLACAGAPDIARVVTLLGPPSSCDTGRAPPWMARPDADASLFASEQIRRQWLESKLLTRRPNDLIAPLPVELHHPALLDRRQIRRRLDVDERTVVIALVGEPPEATDAWPFVSLISMLTHMGRRVVGVAPPDADQLERSLRFIQRLRTSIRIVTDDSPSWRLLPGCDLAVWTAPRKPDIGRSLRRAPGAHALAWAHAFGVPIVTTRRVTVGDSLLAEGGAQVAKSSEPLDLCRAALLAMEKPRDRKHGASPPARSPGAWRDAVQSLHDAVMAHS